MCGRYTLLADKQEIVQEFDLEQELESFHPSYNIAPGQHVLAIIRDGYKKRAGHLRWGLVPAWANDEKIGYKMINARSETAHIKPSFKNLMANKRCLIVADSFYEWKQTANGKQPIRIQLKNRKMFAFAGLWDRWVHEDKTLFTCTILTKEANTFMGDIHHRMPIILPKVNEEEWITSEKLHPNSANQFLQSIQNDEMVAYPVSKHVNTAKNNNSLCIEPITD